MVKNNFITALLNDGWVMTSDPTKQPGGFGQRQLFAYGKNVDSYCNGGHNAFDLAKYHKAPIKTPVNCTVLRGTGWNGFGWTGVFGFIDHNGHWRQFIIGHLDSNPLNFLKIGQNISKGSIIGYQGTSNNLNVSMASHLHIQFQNYESLGEWAFICTGLNAYNIDITTSKATGGKVAASKPTSSTPSAFNVNVDRGRSTMPYVLGTIDNLGAEVRKRNGSQSTGFNWNGKAGYELNPGAKVYIFEVHNGWGRIYTGNLTGHGSNDWIWLGRMKVNTIFK